MLALFVVEPAHLWCEKFGLVQAKSKFRLEARVGGFSVGIAASRIACEFELLDGSISYPNFCAAKGCRGLPLTRARAGSLRHGRICGQAKARSLTHCS